MADESFRIDGLDFLRGLAVMGILLPNIIMFALPYPAVLNPFTIGTGGMADLMVWLGSFLLFDGKMRALFAILFGAAMLLVMESAEMNGRDGGQAHRRRMLWLLPIGLAHYVLLWSGDILLLLALCGLIATRFVRLEALSLIKLALVLLLVQWLINLAVVLPPYWLRAAAQAPGATASTMAAWRDYADQLGMGASTAVAADMARYHLGYLDILQLRVADALGDAVNQLLHGLAELLAFMALGMAMLKGGFLAGQWRPEQYRATWRRALLVGLVPMLGLGLWVLLSRDPLTAQAAIFGWSMPLRLPIAVGLAALAMEIAARGPGGGLVHAVRAVGRLALSNYLLCSLVMTSIFYGYGLGLYGAVDRAMLVPIMLAMWGVMLGWSALWRSHLGQGPAEWLWRRLVRGRSVAARG
ncbi:MAG TPA: DUF418 domain-containing protein [Sphingobium sp.]|nr:DUF418 domain-containing protein [Sphingobium sp.]